MQIHWLKMQKLKKDKRNILSFKYKIFFESEKLKVKN